MDAQNLTATDRKRKTKNPCQVCFLSESRCLCALIPKFHLKTRLSLVIHAKELKRTTNTGRLALAALSNSEMFIRGKTDSPLDFGKLLTPEYQPVLFFPAEEALVLTTATIEELQRASGKPIQLIVPDGNWRQANKVHYRYRELDHVPRVKISTPNTATRHLRNETTEEGMSTLEAIARAFAVIEGSTVGDALLALYKEKLDRTLQGRGTYFAQDDEPVR